MKGTKGQVVKIIAFREVLLSVVPNFQISFYKLLLENQLISTFEKQRLESFFWMSQFRVSFSIQLNWIVVESRKSYETTFYSTDSATGKYSSTAFIDFVNHCHFLKDFIRKLELGTFTSWCFAVVVKGLRKSNGIQSPASLIILPGHRQLHWYMP